VTSLLETHAVAKRYRHRWALADCTLTIPAGHVVGLVGPNGAGKTTLLHLATGLLAPTSGTIEVLGDQPAAGPAQLAKVGFLAQDPALYASLSVAEHLRLGAHLNPGWDARLAADRISGLGLDPAQRAGKLSGGQRAQLALTMALAKRPEALLLDLMVAAAAGGLSIIMSSHLIGDLERVCDYLIVITAAQVRLAGEVDRLLSAHQLLTGPRRDRPSMPRGHQIIQQSYTVRQTTLLVRDGHPVHDPAWTSSPVGLEDMVLAYLSQPGGELPGPRPVLEVQR